MPSPRCSYLRPPPSRTLKSCESEKIFAGQEKPPGSGERYIKPLLLLQEADAGGAGPHTGDHDDVPLSALEPVHSVHCHLWRKGHRYHEEKYWTAAAGREKKYWTILHLRGRKILDNIAPGRERGGHFAEQEPAAVSAWRRT